MRVLGIIPARGGSKGVPGKNTMVIDGKPLVQYAVESALRSKLISNVIVSTDDPKIVKIAEEMGVKVHIREETLASDTSNVLDTVLAILRKLEEKEEPYDAIMLLQPTAPLRKSSDIDESIEMLLNLNVDGVVSVIPVGDHHPARMYKIDHNKLSALHPSLETTRRQELPLHYIRNGCIYLVKTESLKKERTLMPINKGAYIMDAAWSANIDTQQDIVLLKYLMPLWKKEEQK
ncbi:cytidylyltransferase domain-containing protein [Patiriisocius sp. Uisw_017]|jgi:CMP-N,N'-diacetyllegionaminic acid synthase|uniref:acylneuraminate cytidylyltransferase family protein n=1 Tax=Patiriisocius sp. Uisw_017 TaxID=3230968 RepID=UPI0039EA52A4